MRNVWELQAEQDLRGYKALKASLENLPEQIAELRAALTSISSPGANSEGGHGSGDGPDSRAVELYTKIFKLTDALQTAKKTEKRIHRALGALSMDERRVLEIFFIDAERNAAEKTADLFCITRQTAYFRREQAMLKFAIAMYGPQKY